jgi:hypothetical protein
VPALAVVLALALSAAPSAQRGRRNNDTNTGTPTATNAIVDHPDAFYGRQVTVSAGVEQMLSKTAFLIDQRRAIGTSEVTAVGKPVLVIAPYLSAALEEHRYVLVRGDLMKFDLPAILKTAADYTLDLPVEVAMKYQGRPVLIATSVLSARSTELARKPIPPPRPEEVSLSSAMKAINPAFTALRSALDDSKTDVVAQNLMKLQPALTQAEAVWDDLGQSAAAEWTREARARTLEIGHAAASGNWEAAKGAAGKLNTLCQNCHGAYRDRLEDGSFRLRAGSF